MRPLSVKIGIKRLKKYSLAVIPYKTILIIYNTILKLAFRMEALRVSKTTYEKVNKLIAVLMNEAHNFFTFTIYC